MRIPADMLATEFPDLSACLVQRLVLPIQDVVTRNCHLLMARYQTRWGIYKIRLTSLFRQPSTRVVRYPAIAVGIEDIGLAQTVRFVGGTGQNDVAC